MGLLSFFKRQADAENPVPSPAPAEPDAVAAARARARRRLLGATVLLGLGVIGFPLLFETQPRPIAVDIPIDIPRKDGAAPLSSLPAAPLARASAAVVVDADARLPGAVGQGAAERAAAAPPEIVERAGEQGGDGAAAPARPAASLPVAPKLPAVAVAPPARVAAATAPASKPATVAPAKPASDDGARARALLEGGQPSAAAAAASKADARVVVQVGAYTDASKLAETRRKLEVLGFKTYTQVVESEAGTRTRVRVGPFASRAEADKAAARVKSAGLPAAILTL